jgi:hypothetical protein
MSAAPKPNNDFIAINISDSGEPKKYFCNMCNRSLSRMDGKGSEYFCTNCNVSYFPNQGEKLKSQNKFDLPGPEIDAKGRIRGEKMPLIAMVDNDPKPKESGLPPSFEMLKKSGVKITSFHSTVDNESL